MKKIYSIIAGLLMTASVFAQAPEKMSYQAVVRDGSNALVTSTAVGMQISILQTSAGGTPVYVETHTPTSNANGLVSLEIGSGAVVSGDFTTIDWANGPYFIKTETDPDGATGGISYTITGTSQLMSVPYALYAKNTDSWTVDQDTISSNKLVSIVSPSIISSDIELNVEGNSFIDFLMNSQQTGDASIWLKNSNITWRIHNDQSENNSFRIQPWNDFSGYGGNPIGNPLVAPSFSIDTLGNVGVGIVPQQKLHINDVMRLEPRATAPTSPAEGDVYMDSTMHKLMVFDGTTWQACW